MLSMTECSRIWVGCGGGGGGPDPSRGGDLVGGLLLSLGTVSAGFLVGGELGIPVEYTSCKRPLKF